jgi:hypothetical protein
MRGPYWPRAFPPNPEIAMQPCRPLLSAAALVLLAAAAPALAADYVTPADLAQETGLTERQIGMVLGHRTAYPEYLSSYTIVRDKFIGAVGRARYQRLVQQYRAAMAHPPRLVARHAGTRDDAS